MASTTKNLGIVAPVLMREWGASTTYQKLNIVRHSDGEQYSSFMALQASTAIEPDVTNGWEKYWQVLVRDGNSLDLVQETGEDTTVAMSQKAVTDALNAATEKIDNLNLENGTGEYSLQQKGDGSRSKATGNYASATGWYTKASGSYSHSEGVDTTASGDEGSHAEGYHSTASGKFGTHSEGYATTASGNEGAHSEGKNTTASGDEGSHSEGKNTTASGNEGAHAEGRNTKAVGNSSHAEGDDTEANGVSSHSEGFNNNANGFASHSQGGSTQANANYSSTAGTDTIAGYEGQFIVGRLNKNKSNTLFEVGNGQYAGNIRSNAFESLVDGRAKVYGAPTEDEDVVRKKELDTKLTRVESTGLWNVYSEIYINGKSVSTVTPYSENADVSTIASRNSEGKLRVKAGTNGEDCVNFGQLEMLRLDINGTIDSTSTFASVGAIAAAALVAPAKVLRVPYGNIPTTLITPPSGINYGSAYYLFKVFAQPLAIDGKSTLGVIEVTFENYSTSSQGIRPIGYIRQGLSDNKTTWWWSGWNENGKVYAHDVTFTTNNEDYPNGKVTVYTSSSTGLTVTTLKNALHNASARLYGQYTAFGLMTADSDGFTVNGFASTADGIAVKAVVFTISSITAETTTEI